MMNKSADFGKRQRTGTRDAVETAIDLSKRDKGSTWEDLAARQFRRWDADINSAYPDVVGKDHPNFGNATKKH